MREQIGEKIGIAYSLNNIGVFYGRRGKNEKALEYFDRSLKIQEEIGDKQGAAFTLGNIGNIYKDKGQLDKALVYAKKELRLAEELNYPENIEDAARLMSQIFEKQGKGLQALEMFKLYVRMRDSLVNKENQKEAFKKEAQYKYEKQRAEDSVATAKDMLVKNVEIEKQKAEISAKKSQQYFLFGGLGLLLVFAGFMYNRFRVTQKQKRIIEVQKQEVESQKHMVEEKQKEILDSIKYAKRIQTALVTNEKYIQKNLDHLNPD
jgi:tetratricopeptide (TPR) repeat protein